jgi:hypothetical protein
MRASLRFLIVVAAMIAGGYLAAQILGCCFASRTGEWGSMTAVLAIVIVPPAAIFSGMIATILTTRLTHKSRNGKRRRHFPVGQVFN